MTFTDLQQAILSARISNPSSFANYPSNYLIGQGNLQFQQALASTGTYNIVTSGGAGLARTNLSPNTGTYNIQNINGSLVAVPSRMNSTNPQGSSPTSTQQTQSSGVANNSLTDSFNSGINQVGSFFTNHPLALLGIGGIALLLLFKK